MNGRKAEELRDFYEEYHWLCFCGSPANQRAHILGQTKLNYRKYGKAIIDNPLNWRPACGLAHNAMIDIGRSPILCDKLARMISKGDKRGIDEVLRETIHKKSGGVFYG